MPEKVKDERSGQFASGGESGGADYPNAVRPARRHAGGQTVRTYHGSPEGGAENAAKGSDPDTAEETNDG